MIAYNKNSLDQLAIRNEAVTAYKKKLISDDEYDAIIKIHKTGLYSPNIFIRIGLFAAVVVIVLMTFGLLFLIFGAAVDSDISLFWMSLFFAFAVYAALEWIVQNKKHYRSGVDDGLLWLALIFVVCDIAIFSELSSFAIAVLAFLISLAATIRFANSVMSAVMFGSFIAGIFYSLIPFEAWAKSILPFVIMLLSFSIYLVTKNIKQKDFLRHYQFCFMMLEVLSLVTIYASVNYFSVRELTVTMFNLPENYSLSGGWFFWLFTCALPIIYVVRGLQAKDRLILRTGLLLIAATVFTFRYYYTVAPVEQVVTVSGIILTIVAYAAIRYLHTPKHGLTDKQSEQYLQDGLTVESLVIAESFNDVPAAEEGFRFGGGSTGGGGASGQF